MQKRATRALLGLVNFAESQGLIASYDRVYAQNLLLDAMRMDAPDPDAAPQQLQSHRHPLVAELSEIAAARASLRIRPARGRC